MSDLEKLQKELSELTQAIQQQTVAIQNMANSNMMLINAMTQEEDEELLPDKYLDGSPVGS